MGKNKRKGGKNNEGQQVQQGDDGGQQSTTGSHPSSGDQPQPRSSGTGNVPQQQPFPSVGRGRGRQAYPNEPAQNVQYSRPGGQPVAGQGRGGRGHARDNWRTSAPGNQSGVQKRAQTRPYGGQQDSSKKSAHGKPGLSEMQMRGQAGPSGMQIRHGQKGPPAIPITDQQSTVRSPWTQSGPQQQGQNQGRKKEDEKQRGEAQTTSWGDQSPHRQTPVKLEQTRPLPISTKEIQENISKASNTEDYDGKKVEIRNKITNGGKAGRPINLLANHFELKLGKVKIVHHYDFLITPDTPKRMLRTVFELVKRNHFPGINSAFDGRKNAYSPCELPELTTTVTVMQEEGRGKQFDVRVRKVNEINLEEIYNFINGSRNNQIHNPPMNAIQVLDVVLRHTQSSQKISAGSSFFTIPEGKIIDLGGGMQMYRGSYQSVQLGWKPFLNVDVSNKAFPKSLNIIDLILELFSRVNLKEPLKTSQKEILNKHLRTLKIQYTLPNNPTAKRRYGVNEVQDSARSIRFRRDPNSPEMTIEEYYLKEKELALKYPNMPCLWVGSRNGQIKIRVPVEFCEILAGQAVKRKLDGRQTTAMIRECAKSTDERKEGINDAITSANFLNDPVAREFDLFIDDKFAKLTGRVLVPPNLGYENNKSVSVAKGVWKAQRFYNSAELLKWTVLCLDSSIRIGDINNLSQKLIYYGRPLGMNIAPPRPPTIMERLSYGTRGLDELKNYFRKAANEKYNIIFVIIKDRDFQYNYVKEASEIGVGCLTQCIKSYTVQRKLTDATVTNILLKVNAKMNGTNHFLLDQPIFMRTETTMIMGADVTHPSPDSIGIPSVAAVTASHDPQAFQYNLCWRLQPPGQEIILDLKKITREHLMFFYRQNMMAKPDNIIFYRDGVSNGQFAQVLNSELTAIRAACTAVSNDYKPKITFLVVQKRHNTRLFPADPEKDSQDKNKNVPAGTCVDTLITNRALQNFFLVSHASIQGVARPTKYVSLWDDHDFTDDEIETLTFYLCHMFARCTRSVSYPAPTYYAHLAAARAKVYCETRKINIERLPWEQERLTIKEEIIRDLPMFFI